MYSIYLNIYKHTFYYSNLIQLVACVSDVRDILLLSRLSISDSSLSPASLSDPTFILWPVIMTSMIDSGLLAAQEFQLAQEETLRFKRSSFIVGPLPIFCPQCQCCVSRGHGSPRVQAVVTEVTFLHNLCHQPLSPEHYDTVIHTVPSLVHRWLPPPQPGPGPIPHPTVVQTRLEFPHLIPWWVMNGEGEGGGMSGRWLAPGEIWCGHGAVISLWTDKAMLLKTENMFLRSGDNEWMKFVWSSFFLCSIGSSITISTRSKITQRALLPSFRSKLESQTVNYHRVSLPELGK